MEKLRHGGNSSCRPEEKKEKAEKKKEENDKRNGWKNGNSRNKMEEKGSKI